MRNLASFSISTAIAAGALLALGERRAWLCGAILVSRTWQLAEVLCRFSRFVLTTHAICYAAQMEIDRGEYNLENRIKQIEIQHLSKFRRLAGNSPSIAK
jgi:hypothetical protein